MMTSCWAFFGLAFTAMNFVQYIVIHSCYFKTELMESVCIQQAVAEVF